MWGREGLPLKQRSMLNLAMISILNRPHELKAHIKGALTNGVTKNEIMEVFFAGRDLCRRALRGGLVPDRARGVRGGGEVTPALTCPHKSRASTSCLFCESVDGWDKPGHDAEMTKNRSWLTS